MITSTWVDFALRCQTCCVDAVSDGNHRKKIPLVSAERQLSNCSGDRRDGTLVVQQSKGSAQPELGGKSSAALASGNRISDSIPCKLASGQ